MIVYIHKVSPAGVGRRWERAEMGHRKEECQRAELRRNVERLCINGGCICGVVVPCE